MSVNLPSLVNDNPANNNRKLYRNIIDKKKNDSKLLDIFFSTRNIYVYVISFFHYAIIIRQTYNYLRS